MAENYVEDIVEMIEEGLEGPGNVECGKSCERYYNESLSVIKILERFESFAEFLLDLVEGESSPDKATPKRLKLILRSYDNGRFAPGIADWCFDEESSPDALYALYVELYV